MTIIESEQSRETRLTQIVRGPFIFRFASYRKSEDAKFNLRSEDYIVSELTSERAQFVLCDGVGSSFYGGIGSQFLGETILNWLRKASLPANMPLGKNESANNWLNTLTLNLKIELNNKVNLATNIIQQKELTSKEELIRLAEMSQRDDFGTQSNFVSGIVWPKSTQLPNGYALLFWLGNARVRIFNNDKDLTHFLGWGNNPDQLKEVWSSKEGVVGDIYSYQTDFSKITTIIAYSDGLENVEEQIHPDINETQLETLVNRAQSIKDDDVTYLELSPVRSEVVGISDDIVNILRNQTQLSSSQPQSESDERTHKSDTLNAQVLENEKLRRIFIIAIVIVPLLCFSMGLLLGSVLSLPLGLIATSTPSFTVSPSETITPSFTASPSETMTPSFTASPSETITPSFTASLSQTPPITPTFTLTMTPTTTATFTSTPTNTMATP